MQLKADFIYDGHDLTDPLWAATSQSLVRAIPIPADYLFRWISLGHLLPMTYEVDARGAAKCCLNEGNDTWA